MHFKLNINDNEAMIVSKFPGEKNSKESLVYKDSFKDSNEDKTLKRSKRSIKKTKKAMSISSDDFEDESIQSRVIEEKQIYDEEIYDTNADIVMEGNLIYRYELDQIELEGVWSISNDNTRERFSYLMLKNRDKNLICLIKGKDICRDNYFYDERDLNNMNIYTNYPTNSEDYKIHICSANLFESLLIPQSNIFQTILNFLSGEYHGFFLYYNKTIEDRFYLNFSIEDNQVRINGNYN